jgi:hypothetical protein
VEFQSEGSKEYIDVIKCTDQNNRLYVITLYDNDELWQELKLIDIFCFNNKDGKEVAEILYSSHRKSDFLSPFASVKEGVA